MTSSVKSGGRESHTLLANQAYSLSCHKKVAMQEMTVPMRAPYVMKMTCRLLKMREALEYSTSISLYSSYSILRPQTVLVLNLVAIPWMLSRGEMSITALKLPPMANEL